jgi:hypothetical protein
MIVFPARFVHSKSVKNAIGIVVHSENPGKEHQRNPLRSILKKEQVWHWHFALVWQHWSFTESLEDLL